MDIAVTVYIPTKNRCVLLQRAVRSVLEQSADGVEVIVVDDCSTDGTVEIVEKLIDENRTGTTLRFIRLPSPSGACVARNRAIEAASGRFVTGLDDDDYFLPGRIAGFLDAFDPSRESFVFGSYIREQPVQEGLPSRRMVTLPAFVGLERLLMRNVVGNQVFTTRERLLEVGGFDKRLAAWQDYDLWIRLLRRYGPARGVKAANYVHSVDASAVRISNDHKRIEQAFKHFCAVHREYDDQRLRSCLALSKATYGSSTLSVGDIVNVAGLGWPYLTLSACYFYVRNRYACLLARGGARGEH